jgi:hypothetical protein
MGFGVLCFFLIPAMKEQLGRPFKEQEWLEYIMLSLTFIVAGYLIAYYNRHKVI